MKLTDGILPAVLLVAWVASWWRGTLRLRLWFALLAPIACLGGVVLGLIGAEAGSERGDVQQWAASFDSPSPGVAWLEESSLLAFGLAVGLAVITLIVEYILLVRRDPH